MPTIKNPKSSTHKDIYPELKNSKTLKIITEVDK